MLNICYICCKNTKYIQYMSQQKCRGALQLESWLRACRTQPVLLGAPAVKFIVGVSALACVSVLACVRCC